MLLTFWLELVALEFCMATSQKDPAGIEAISGHDGFNHVCHDFAFLIALRTLVSQEFQFLPI